MNVNPENMVENILPQDNVAINLDIHKVDTNLKQSGDQNANNTGSEPVSEDPNWRAFREARKKDKAERAAAEQKASEKEAEVAALKAAMEAAFSKSAPQVPNYSNSSYEYQEEETEDQRIEKKVEYEKIRQQQEHQQYPQKLAQTYSDFHQTIADEHLDYLDYHYPEVSNPLKMLPDGFDKWSHIYKAIKKFVPNVSNAKKDAFRADANFAKPKSISSPSITDIGTPSSGNRLSDDRKAANWERMQKLLKGVS